MGILQVNPAAEAGSDFPTFQPGVYRMRIVEVTDRSIEGKADYKVKLSFADQSQLVLLTGQAYAGSLEGAGSLFDYVMQAPDKQWKLRQLTEACGLPWEAQDFTQSLVGREVDVKVKTEKYEGEDKNKVARYVAAK